MGQAAEKWPVALRGSFVVLLSMAMLVISVPLTAQGAVAPLQTSQPTPGAVTEFHLPWAPSTTGVISQGPEGNIWFGSEIGEPHGPHEFLKYRSELDRITPGGAVSTVVAPLSVAAATKGPDGNFWFTQGKGIARITASAEVTDFPPSMQEGSDELIVSALDGNLWFGRFRTPPGDMSNLILDTEPFLDRETPTGQLTEIPIATRFSSLGGMAAGPDGNIWFTDPGRSVIARITPTGQVAEFPLPPDSQPMGITAGPDGNLWFTERGGNAIGRITPSGQIAEFPFPSKEDAWAGNIVSGPDNRLWFDYGDGVIGQVTPKGIITVIALPVKTEVADLTVGAEGDIWYTARSEGICNGGGGSCSTIIPSAPGIVGRIAPASRSIEFSSIRSARQPGKAKVGLVCGGGDALEACIGDVRLSNRGATVADRHYRFAAGERRVIPLRLSGPARRALKSRHSLHLAARATVQGGKRISRKVVLTGLVE